VVHKLCEWLSIEIPLQTAKQTLGNHSSWPELLTDAAFHGLAGKIVRTIDPETESDPAAILIQLLTAFGNMVGRNAHVRIEAAAHFPNLFTVIVGRTAKSRKGSSWAQVAHLMKKANQEWRDQCVRNGCLSSGEGLIWAVRDPVEKMKRGKLEIVDEGVSDKRLLVIESEFVSVLRMISRDGNILSPTIRSAWDDGNLNTLTKNSPARATDAHISIIGHITLDELRREMRETEGTNGLFNRIIWFCVRRSKSLPLGGHLDQKRFDVLSKELRKSWQFAVRCRELSFSKRARRLWCRKYDKLAAEVPGLFGAVTSRAEAQVLRLAIIYALVDRSRFIEAPHLRAALAVWKYAEDSARYIFGRQFGDRLIDDLLAALRKSPNGLTRTQIRREVFTGNKSEEQIKRALSVLREHRFARVVKEKTMGRTAKRWFAR
jgi:uncharacterized protein DUF3987